jgi:hypothetical protein
MKRGAQTTSAGRAAAPACRAGRHLLGIAPIRWQKEHPAQTGAAALPAPRCRHRLQNRLFKANTSK